MQFVHLPVGLWPRPPSKALSNYQTNEYCTLRLLDVFCRYRLQIQCLAFNLSRWRVIREWFISPTKGQVHFGTSRNIANFPRRLYTCHLTLPPNSNPSRLLSWSYKTPTLELHFLEQIIGQLYADQSLEVVFLPIILLSIWLLLSGMVAPSISIPHSSK